MGFVEGSELYFDSREDQASLISPRRAEGVYDRVSNAERKRLESWERQTDQLVERKDELEKLEWGLARGILYAWQPCS